MNFQRNNFKAALGPDFCSSSRWFHDESEIPSFRNFSFLSPKLAKFTSYTLSRGGRTQKAVGGENLQLQLKPDFLGPWESGEKGKVRIQNCCCFLREGIGERET
jgi:hypothetical protein